MAPPNPWSTSKGEQFTLKWFLPCGIRLLCDYLVSSLKSKGNFPASNFQTFSRWSERAGLAGVPEPHNAATGCWPGSGGSWWEASWVPGERCLPCLSVSICWTPTKWRQICGKAVCSAEMLPHPLTSASASAGFTSQLQLPTAVLGSWIHQGWGSSHSRRGWGWNRACFWTWTFCWQPKQAVSMPLLCTFALGTKLGASVRETWEIARWPQRRGARVMSPRNHIIIRLLERTGSFMKKPSRDGYLVKGNWFNFFHVFHNKMVCHFKSFCVCILITLIIFSVYTITSLLPEPFHHSNRNSYT